jgi:hypothetical protein
VRRTTTTLACLLIASAALAVEKSEQIVKSFPAQPDKLVLIDAGPLDVHVRVAEIPDIRVKVELVAGALSEAQGLAWVEAHRPTFEDSEGGLRIIAPDPSGANIAKGVIFSKARLELVVPATVRVDLSTSSGTLTAVGEYTGTRLLRLRTASGDLELAGWAGEIEARTTSGDIRIKASKTITNLLARTASGDIDLSGGIRALRCDTSSGSIHADGLLGSVGIVTTTGSVVARFDALAPGDTVSVATVSGQVRLTLPPAASPSGELACPACEIRSAFPGEGDGKTGKLRLSGKGPRIDVTADKGKIDLS